MAIIDSQVHAYEANTPKRPWHTVPNWPDHADQDEPPVEAVDEVERRRAPRTRTAGTRNVRISALTAAVEFVDPAMMMVRPKSGMFPPIWVNAWASQRNRNERFLKTASAPPDSSVPGAGVLCVSLLRGGVRHEAVSRAVGLTAALIAVAAGHDSGQPPLKGPPLDQHVPVAPPAAQPDVGAEPVDEPLVAAAGMGAPQPQDVADLDRG